MAVRRKQPRKPVKLASFGKQLQLVTKEAKRLDAHILVLKKMFRKGNFRML
jgi:hypothetical protein